MTTDKKYEFTEEDLKFIEEEDGYIDEYALDAAIRYGGSYVACRKMCLLGGA